MGCVCCLQSPCVPLCRMPQEIFVDISLGSLLFQTNWTVSAADIATISAAINGTYSLQNDVYFGGTFRYVYSYGSPYQFPNSDLRFTWNCNDVSGRSAIFDIDLCYAGTPYNADRYLRIEPNIGEYIYDTDIPDITGYCSGTPISASIVSELRAMPETACGTNPLGYQKLAGFDLNLTFYE